MLNFIEKIVIIIILCILSCACESYDTEIPDHKIQSINHEFLYPVPKKRAQVYLIYLSSRFCVIDCPIAPLTPVTLRNPEGISYRLSKPLGNTHFSCLELKPGNYSLFTENNPAAISLSLKQNKVIFIGAKTNVDKLSGQYSYELKRLTSQQGQYYINKDVLESKKILKTNISWSNEVRYYPSLIKIPKSCQIIN